MNEELNNKCNEVRNEIIRRLQEQGHTVENNGYLIDGESVSWNVRTWGRKRSNWGVPSCSGEREVPEVKVGDYKKRMKKDGSFPYDEAVQQILHCVHWAKQRKIQDAERQTSLQHTISRLEAVGMVKDQWGRYNLPGQFTSMELGSDGSIGLKIGFTAKNSERAIAFIELLKKFAEQDKTADERVA